MWAISRRIDHGDATKRDDFWEGSPRARRPARDQDAGPDGGDLAELNPLIAAGCEFDLRRTIIGRQGSVAKALARLSPCDHDMIARRDDVRAGMAQPWPRHLDHSPGCTTHSPPDDRSLDRPPSEGAIALASDIGMAGPPRRAMIATP